MAGSVGDGSLGVPVAGGHDCDGDGYSDFAMASIRASPLGRAGAGEVFLAFGDGRAEGTLDTGVVQQRILRIYGDGASEVTGSVLWIADVTGDFVYARLQATSDEIATGYPPRALALWARRAQAWAAGGAPDDLATIAGRTSCCALR